MLGSEPRTAEREAREVFSSRGSMPRRLALALPPLFLLANSAAILFGKFHPAPRALAVYLWGPIALPGSDFTKYVNGSVTFFFWMLAPFGATLVCLWRGIRSREYGRENWMVVACALLCCTMAQGAVLIGWVIPKAYPMFTWLGYLLSSLYAAPLAFVFASPGEDKWSVRLIDGALALTLGILFFIFATGSTPAFTADISHPQIMLIMFDIQNAYISIFALIRFRASFRPWERALFGPLTIFGFANFAVNFYVSHFSFNAPFGGPVDVIANIPFLLLAAQMLWGWEPRSVASPHAPFVRVVRTASPLMLPASLLTISAALVATNRWLAIGGFVVATLGYGVRAVLTQLQSLTERDQLTQLSHVDALTGLPNRRHFDEALHRELTRARRTGDGVALLMIDIDHFKLLNDALGHAAGDAALRATAQALQNCAKRGTDVVARYGGEEFAAILPHADPGEALALAESMRSAVMALALPSPAPEGRLTVSIGAARSLDSLYEATALVEAADGALYDAKRQGRNRVAADRSLRDGRLRIVGS